MEHECGTDVTYSANLPSYQLILEIQRLLNLARRTERTLCRYMADLADRIHDQRDVTLALYSDEFHAARCFFGLGARETRERVRIGRALRDTPEIDRAFGDGRLSYSRVREISRVATAETEQEWLAVAQNVDMRTLERRVAAARERLESSEQKTNAVIADRASSIPEQGSSRWIPPAQPRSAAELHRLRSKTKVVL